MNENKATEITREVLETDILIVGAGPAGLSLAYHLASLFTSAGRAMPEILLMEKGKYPGAHSLSGAVMDPKGIAELIPDFIERGAPLESAVTADSFYLLTESSAIKSPLMPPPLRNHGNYVISLNKFTGWLAGQVEAKGIDIFSGLSGYDLLVEDGRVVGVQTVDLGVDKEGSQKPNFEPGSIIRAKVTVLCEGVHGSLTRRAFEQIPELRADKLPPSYLAGVKEVWEVPAGRINAGEVIHTVGFPQPMSEYGGGGIYGMSETMVSVGYAVGLDSTDPTNDPHRKFQKYKTHKLVHSILDGGKMQHYGAKAIPIAGYFAMPKLTHDGLMLCGDSAGMLNARRLKGIHLAIKSGMLAAETLFEAVKAGDFSAARLGQYEKSFESSWAMKEIHEVRNFHAGFKGGLMAGLFHAGVQMMTGGRGLFERREHRADYTYVKKRAGKQHENRHEPVPQKVKFDNELTFDKVTDVYHSGTMHEEHQPSHLVITDINICNDQCTKEFGNPCQHFCPATVYNMVDNLDKPGKLMLQLTPSNCVHCKICDILDPYQIIRWVTPQGGEGPNYVDL